MKIATLVCAASAWWMTGLVWFVQVVHYPLFANVGSESFREYHAQHVRRTQFVVMLPMVLELVLAIYISVGKQGLDLALGLAGVMCISLVWLMTGVRQLKDHEALSKGFNEEAQARLLKGNFWRSVVWLGHSVIVMIQCARLS